MKFSCWKCREEFDGQMDRHKYVPMHTCRDFKNFDHPKRNREGGPPSTTIQWIPVFAAVEPLTEARTRIQPKMGTSVVEPEVKPTVPVIPRSGPSVGKRELAKPRVEPVAPAATTKPSTPTIAYDLDDVFLVAAIVLFAGTCVAGLFAYRSTFAEKLDSARATFSRLLTKSLVQVIPEATADRVAGDSPYPGITGSAPIASAQVDVDHGRRPSGEAEAAREVAPADSLAQRLQSAPISFVAANEGVTEDIQPPVPACRLVSNGRARLIEDPATVLPLGEVIAVSIDGTTFPYFLREQDEDCRSWRHRVASLVVVAPILGE